MIGPTCNTSKILVVRIQIVRNMENGLCETPEAPLEAVRFKEKHTGVFSTVN